MLGVMGSIGVDGYHIDVILVGELFRLSSYYTGRWVSHYSLDVVNGSAHVLVTERVHA